MKIQGGKFSKKEAQEELSKEDRELMDLLSPKRSIDLRIQSIFQDLPEKFIVLVLEHLKEYALVNMRLINFFSENKVPGVYVTINKPLESLKSSLGKENISYKNVFFVDAITKLTSDSVSEEPRFVFVDSPKNLIDISVAIENAVQRIKSEKPFIIVDSLNTLLVYNKPPVVEKFVHSISGKMRAWNTKGIFLMVENKELDVTRVISQFCDQVIEV